ncbi:AraC family transcriptional regulator [Mycetocola tolaasinivorans]|uniref:AraC family transcriptional regulator n=1 Tax=Mycetocola tolaasinivorans TaxID=76635 RepID=A0A3L7A2P9_9MICO|nr:AraC family transcriptional regulator [Mycetocola tolaasinivorans]RLP74576.1 AraC family transcriptional regulator [Mycetocola tolaasinivorans]
MTVLEDVLSLAGVRGSLTTPISAGNRWGFALDAVPEAAFHAITEGVAYLSVPGHETIQMLPGDVVLLPHGSAHEFASDRETTPVHFDRYSHVRSREPGEVLEAGAAPRSTNVLCAFYVHNLTTSTALFDLLPEIIYIPARPEGGSIVELTRLLAREVSQPGMASTTVIDRLIDVLLIHILREWTATTEFTEASWLRGLTDPTVAAALNAIHDDPARDWGLDDLAEVAHVSRATLSRRFSTLVGQSPGAYLVSWRMDLAARSLRETDDRIAAIAHRVGYTSEFAFSRAFSRAFDIAPRAYREGYRLASPPAQ